MGIRQVTADDKTQKARDRSGSQAFQLLEGELSAHAADSVVQTDILATAAALFRGALVLALLKASGTTLIGLGVCCAVLTLLGNPHPFLVQIHATKAAASTDIIAILVSEPQYRTGVRACAAIRVGGSRLGDASEQKSGK
jgi:hypothetical protein